MEYQRLAFGLGEIKFASDSDETMQFTGHGAVFSNVDAGGDGIEPGAFSAFLADVKAERQPWPAMLSQHGGMGLTAQDLTPVGVWTDLAEDGHGLKVVGKLADTPRGQELYRLMKMKPRPAIDGMSIGYRAKEWEPRTKPDEPRRRLKRLDLFEISPVTFPMNGKARVTGVKSIDVIETLSDAERYLRDAGWSRAEALAFVSRVKRLGPSDSDDHETTAALQRLISRITN